MSGMSQNPPVKMLEILPLLGEIGAKYLDGEKIVEIPAKINEVIDTTGAGDALLAGVVYGIANGMDIEKSLKIGVNWASSTIASESSLPSKWSEKYIIS